MLSTPFAEEGAPERAMRPITFPSNPALSSGPIENFFSLSMDPDTVADTLSPHSDPGEGTGHLPVINRTMAWQEVTVNETLVGFMGPLTTGVIHNIGSGTYLVQMKSSTGYVDSQNVETVDSVSSEIAPGNENARAALEGDYIKPGFALHTSGGELVGYAPPRAPEPEPEPEVIDGEGDIEGDEVDASEEN